VPNLKFLPSTVREIWRKSQNVKSRSHDLILHFFRLGPPVANLHATFEVTSFNRFRDMAGVKKFQKVGHVTPSRPLLNKFCIFCQDPLVANLCAKFEISSFNRSRDIKGVPKFKKSRSRDPFTTSFDLVLHFFFLGPLVVNLHAKCDISSFNRFRDMEGAPKF